MSRKEYFANRERIFEIYGKERKKSWNTHHIKHKKDGGGNEKANLFPIPKDIHRQLHKRGMTNRQIHEYILREYGHDPYE